MYLPNSLVSDSCVLGMILHEFPKDHDTICTGCGDRKLRQQVCKEGYTLGSKAWQEEVQLKQANLGPKLGKERLESSTQDQTKISHKK